MGNKWLFAFLTAADVVATGALCLYPIRTTFIRSAIVGGVVLVLPLVIGALWRYRGARRVALGFAAVAMLGVVAVGVLPGRAGDPVNLRRAYLESLRSFESAPYLWGGETHRGIDCSGLPRIAWMHANFSMGVAAMNCGLLREAAFLWWEDSSARHFTTGYESRLDMVTANPANLALLRAGDLAVTPDGSHVLVYLGNEEWIEADPGPALGQVHTSTQPEARLRKMTIMRWRALGE